LKASWGFVTLGAFIVLILRLGSEARVLSLAQFELLTFDCYGTLVDWESGILSTLRPLLIGHGKLLNDTEILELYGEFEAQAESGEYRSYHEVLQSVIRSFGKHLSFTPTVEETDSLYASVPRWRPWPDTVAALKKLGSRYRLAIISNIDDDLFAATRPHLHTDFQSVTTAQQARCYKPSLKIFRSALEKARVPEGRILHVGQSIYHDVVPAQSLGLATVWVNRPSRRSGVGAVKKSEGKPDLEVADLQTLANLAIG
jgi:2-haloacid dehalogenase